MFFRFVAALIILTGISIYGMSLEKRNLKRKRFISEEHYQIQSLEEKRSRLFLKTQQLGAPPRLIRDWNSADQYLVIAVEKEEGAPLDKPSPPLLQWRLKQDETAER